MSAWRLLDVLGVYAEQSHLCVLVLFVFQFCTVQENAVGGVRRDGKCVDEGRVVRAGKKNPEKRKTMDTNFERSIHE